MNINTDLWWKQQLSETEGLRGVPPGSVHMANLQEIGLADKNV